MRRSIIVLLAALAVSSCGIVRSNPFARASAQTPLPYRATLAPVTRGGSDFTVRVTAPGAALPSFRESARFPGTRYCLRHFGSSDIAWRRDPATGDWAVRLDGEGHATVAGRCNGR